MTLSQETINRIRQLYDICYGLASEAERILLEEDPTSTVGSGIITKYWRAQNLEPNKKGDVLENLVREAFDLFEGEPEKMREYLKQKSSYEEGDRKLLRVYVPDNASVVYSKKLGLKIKVNTNHARNALATKTRRQATCGTKLKNTSKYGLSAPPESYS